jgi:hypothetical protein
MRKVNSLSRLPRSQLLYYTALSVILLGIFALYAPSLRLTTLFDDAYIITVIGNRNLLSVFDLTPYGAMVYRPMSYVPWLLVRDWFGWFRPDMLHYLNVGTHILNTALLASLALRMSHVWRLKGIAFPGLAALVFGLFPFSFQAVLWPSALPHPLMTLYGLAGAHAYLATRANTNGRRRLAWLFVSAMLLFAACLCHEQGFIFGIMVALIECTLSWHEHRRPRGAAFVLVALMFIYALFIKLFAQTMWTDPTATMLAVGLSDWLTSLAYVAQGMLAWFFILFRNVIGLPQEKTALLLGLLLVNTLGVLGLLYWLKRLSLGLLSLAWWCVAIAPSVLLLSQYYVLSGPRLMYAASIGVALLYAGLIAALLSATRSRVLKGIMLAFVLLLSAWCVPYVMERTNVTARLTDSIKSIDQDLRASPAESKVLLIDMPGWVSMNNPAFLLGSEGMLFFQDNMVSPSTMIASVGNTWRDTVHVRDVPSPAYGEDHLYGVAGPLTEGEALKAQVLKANYIYRFYFDAPGLRVERLAILEPATPVVNPVARLAKGTASVVLENAQAVACQGYVILDLTWSGATAIQEPVAVFVHGLDAGGAQVVVADRDPVGGLVPLNETPAGIQVNERRVITTTVGMAAITQLQVGVYSRVDGQRYQAARADGSLWEGESIMLPVAGDDNIACRN